ncbi:MAG: hypothetical protein HY834_11870 [Devosia nanyangense]|uniref:DUF2283 domain-containing protein n=1 Tax=Devosia nanyangense TaxID=1228055 RepID=A0A933L1W7_9HYPH|nr:hypothetical protein [Devosia nanyangense]
MGEHDDQQQANGHSEEEWHHPSCLLPQSPAAALAHTPNDGRFRIEHPTGAVEVYLDVDKDGSVRGAGTVRTARKLMDGVVFPRSR